MEAGGAVAVTMYPEPWFSHEEICKDRRTFIHALTQFHLILNVRFRNPVIGGKDLDLYSLYVQVTQRGGIKKVILDGRLREVIAALEDRPVTSNSLPYIVRTHYLKFLYQFEQVYFFGTKGPLVNPPDILESKCYRSRQLSNDPAIVSRRTKRLPNNEQLQDGQSVHNYDSKDKGLALAPSNHAPLGYPSGNVTAIPAAASRSFTLPPITNNRQMRVAPSTAPLTMNNGNIPSISILIASPTTNGLQAPNLIHLHDETENCSPVAPINNVPQARNPSNSSLQFGDVPDAPVAVANGSHYVEPANVNLVSSSLSSLLPARATPGSTKNFTGTIDSEVENGYMVTSWIRSQMFRGVLYHTPQDRNYQVNEASTSTLITPLLPPPTMKATASMAPPPPTDLQRKRKKLNYSDVRLPKPSRTAYNFFFAEKYQELKVLYPNNERGLCRLIVESWKGLNQGDKNVYLELGRRDGERYKKELMEYWEKMNLPSPRQPRSCKPFQASEP